MKGENRCGWRILENNYCCCVLRWTQQIDNLSATNYLLNAIKPPTNLTLSQLHNSASPIKHNLSGRKFSLLLVLFLRRLLLLRLVNSIRIYFSCNYASRFLCTVSECYVWWLESAMPNSSSQHPYTRKPLSNFAEARNPQMVIRNSSAECRVLRWSCDRIRISCRIARKTMPTHISLAMHINPFYMFFLRSL